MKKITKFIFRSVILVIAVILAFFVGRVHELHNAASSESQFTATVDVTTIPTEEEMEATQVVENKIDESMTNTEMNDIEDLIESEANTEDVVDETIESDNTTEAHNVNGEENVGETIIEEEVSVAPEVPRYFQSDYPDTPYDGGTVADSGCSITCLAMVATYMFDEEYRPDKLALRYDIPYVTNIIRMENASKCIGLGYEYSESWDYVLECLEEGKVAIVLVGEGSIFSSGPSGHFVVFTGLTEDGKIMVNDPSMNNWYKYYNGFENGFDIKRVRYGFSAAWIYEKGVNMVRR